MSVAAKIKKNLRLVDQHRRLTTATAGVGRQSVSKFSQDVIKIRRWEEKWERKPLKKEMDNSLFLLRHMADF